ncbi:MAG TPA: MotA/TolQ/ExbB proton channel family protein [Tepidisphaeraceae bacterium]|nr:MotA/TolQ/ExbB proton channel family protein [Tepidisphaeraceae bacterium]
MFNDNLMSFAVPRGSIPLAEATSFWQLVVTSIKASSAIENAILLLLLICSIASWGIVLWKLKVLREAWAGNQQMAEAFVAATDPAALNGKAGAMAASPNVIIYQAAQDAVRDAGGTRGASNGRLTAGGNPLMAKRGIEERVQMAMEHTSRSAFTRMHRGMDILASIASSTPFIGLFGTVLGIMHTFQVLGTAKSASLNVVAPGIAAALIATAAGLAVAIPAVFAYNWLTARMDELQEQADMFIESLGQWFVGTGLFKHAPEVNHQSHEATDPVIVGEGAHVPGSRE